MAKKEAVQAEFELEDDKKAKDTDGEAEVIVDSKEDKAEKVEENDTDKKIKELQGQIDKERAESKASRERADRLERERSEANAKAEKAEKSATISQKDAIVQALAASEEALVVHRAAYKAALEAGDSAAVVEAQEKLAEAKYANSDIKKAKGSFEQWEKQQEELAKQPKVAPQTPETTAWIGRNPRFETDAEFKSEATAAHYAAINKGYRPDSSAYFEFIDKRVAQVLGETKKQDEVVIEEPKKVIKEASYSAPPSRGSGGDSGSSGGKKQYRLTAEQAEAAEFMNMTTVQYAEFLEAEKKRK